MKMKPEHYRVIETNIRFTVSVEYGNIGELTKIYESGNYPNSHKTKDVEMRMRWDLFNKTMQSKWVCDNLYPYLNDTHIDTALKKIIKDMRKHEQHQTTRLETENS